MKEDKVLLSNQLAIWLGIQLKAHSKSILLKVRFIPLTPYVVNFHKLGDIEQLWLFSFILRSTYSNTTNEVDVLT